MSSIVLQTERIYGVLSPYHHVFRDAPSDEKRIERLKFHVNSGDYFPMLATILGFVEESLQTCTDKEGLSTRQVALMKEVRKDLMHLYKNYRIVKNTQDQ